MRTLFLQHYLNKLLAVVVLVTAMALETRADDVVPAPAALASGQDPKMVPSEVRALMPKGAISLRWQKIGSAKDALGLHLFCVPAGRSPELKYFVDKVPSGPIAREEITVGPSLKESPFFLDVLQTRGAKWKRLNSVPFRESKDAQEILLRWLDPVTRRAPVLLLHFGYTHWHEWVVLTFPRGWSGPAFSQIFLWGGEGDVGLMQRFDRRDAANRMVVEEEEWENGKRAKHIYRWNGTLWEDATQKYFVIGDSVRTRNEAEAIRVRRGWGEVLFSSEYPRLRRGYWLWVPARFRSLDEARQRVRELKQNGITTYVRRAM